MDLQGKRNRVTGGAGVIGSHIADLPVEEHVREIVVLDNFVRGGEANLSAALANGRVRIVSGDMRDQVLVRRKHAVRRCALSSGCDPDHAWSRASEKDDTNSAGSWNFVAAAIANAHKEPVYSSPRDHRSACALAQSERMQSHVIILPLFHKMTAEGREQVAEALQAALGTSGTS